MKLWWRESTAETFLVGEMSNFWSVAEGLPPSPPVEKTLLLPLPQG